MIDNSSIVPQASILSYSQFPILGDEFTPEQYSLWTKSNSLKFCSNIIKYLRVGYKRGIARPAIPFIQT